jgi:hypothetical protein
MPYDRIPGISAVLRDGGLLTARPTTQPRIIILGSAPAGDSYRMFTVTELNEAENEFNDGAQTSEMIQKAHEVFAEGGENIALMRIGGTKGSLVVTDPDGTATMTITPELRDDEATDRYGLIIQLNADGELQVLIWDHDDEDWAYDSDGILNSDNTEIDIQVSGSWSSTAVIGDYNDPRDTTLTPLLSAVDGWDSARWSAVETRGTDGTSMSFVERYAALEEAYQFLDYRDGDMIIPCGVYLDAPNIAERDDGSHHEGGTGSAVYTPDFSSVPTAGDAADDVLGWLWQYLYRGKVYTYFCDGDIFADNATLTLTEAGAGSAVTVTAIADGFAGQDLSLTVTTSGTPGTVTVVGGLDIVVVANVADTGADVAGYISGDPTASALVSASGTAGSGTANWPAATGPTSLALSVSYLDQADLTGDAVPAAVLAKFEAGTSVQLRECNFGHQLASFCYRGSTAWKTMLGFISVAPPDVLLGFGSRMLSRFKIRTWAGDIPTFSSFGTKEGVDSASDNGEGVLGLKFLGGASGYRYAGLDGYGDATDGLAYGGLVMTRGASLPNQGDWVYGISTNDELNDAAGFPVDIGRHIFVTYDYPVHTNALGGGSSYRGTMEAALAGKIAGIPENQEPIGPVNGQIASLSRPLSMTASLTNEFAEVRAIGLMTDERTGAARNIIVTCRTGAHPDSDYTRVSTIRCVNREIQGIRNIAMPYIGQSFSSTTLVSLQQAIDGFLKAERTLGYNQGAVARLSYTREDRIMGRLTVTLRMIPPFAIEAITIQVSLAAEEAEL